MVNWCRISDILLDSAMTAIATIGLGVLAGYLVDKYYRRRRFQEQEDVLLRLAELREEGVALRNKAVHTTFEDDEFDNWNKDIEKWKKKLFKKTSEFSKVEGRRIQTLDFMPADVSAVFNENQLHVLRYVNETLRRLEKLLEQRFRPTQSP